MQNESSRRINQVLAFVCQNRGAFNAAAGTEDETGVARVALRVCSLITSINCLIASSSFLYSNKNLKSFLADFINR